MTEWMLAHPWMTFFLGLALLNAVSVSVVWRRGRKDDDE